MVEPKLTEQDQVQAIVNAAQAAANELSLAGNHLAAANIQGLIQLTRVFWTRLNPPAEEESKPALSVVPAEGAGV